MKKRVAWMHLGALLIATPLLVAADGGRITMVSAESDLLTAAGMVTARDGSVLTAGDSIRTGPAGGGQIWMEDDSLLVLGSGTDLKITAFNLRNKTADYSLEKGGVRLVTGRIAPTLHGPFAEARGTGDFSTMICGVGCDAPIGIYFLVDRGSLSVSSPFGQLAATKGQLVFVNSGGAPRLVTKAPRGMTHLLAELQIDIDPFFGADIRIEAEVPRDPPPSPS